MKTTTRFFVSFLLALCLALAGCSKSAVAVLTDIMTGIEAITPTLVAGGVIPPKYAQYAAWTTSAAAVVSQCATTAASGVTNGAAATSCYSSAQTAANQFLTLSPDDQAKAAAVEKSIQIILAMFVSPPAAAPAAEAQLRQPLITKPADIQKMGQLRARAQAVRVRLAPH